MSSRPEPLTTQQWQAIAQAEELALEVWWRWVRHRAEAPMSLRVALRDELEASADEADQIANLVMQALGEE